jgi:hypothetical protein
MRAQERECTHGLPGQRRVRVETDAHGNLEHLQAERAGKGEALVHRLLRLAGTAQEQKPHPPARRAAAATRASPNGSVGMLIRSVFGETKSTFMPSSYTGDEAVSRKALAACSG